MPLLNDVEYILNNSDIEYEYDGKKFKNNGLDNFIRLNRFIPCGITIVKKRNRHSKKSPQTEKENKKESNKESNDNQSSKDKGNRPKQVPKDGI
jgi:hypothetical protein